MAYPDYTNNFDTKWKDQRTPCKYDVDDPTFCSPMSVISGLVSGFCERQAVVNSTFVTGITASPVTSDWFAATSAGRDAIVNSCVQHVISHDLKPSDVGAESYKGLVDGSFHPVDRATVVDGGVTKTTTYMTHMDGLIDSLVQTGEYKTDITGGTTYTTFEQLASAARDATAGTASACGLAVSGGTAYSSEFMPMFPKAWALERKWMLEQLRYTGTQGITNKTIGRNDGVIMVDNRSESPSRDTIIKVNDTYYKRHSAGDHDEYYPFAWSNTNGAGIVYTAMLYPTIGDNAHNSATSNDYDITGVTANSNQYTNNVVSSYNAGTPTQHLPIDSDTGRINIETGMVEISDGAFSPSNWDTTAGPGATVTTNGTTVTFVSAGGSYTMPSYLVLYTSAYEGYPPDQIAFVNDEYVSGSAVNQLDIVGQNIGGKTIPVSVFFDRPRELDFGFCDVYGHTQSIYVTGATTIQTNPGAGAVIVLSGGTATVTCEIEKAIVEPDGVLSIGADGYVKACCILSGGTTSGTLVGEYRDGTNELTVSTVLHNFIPCQADGAYQSNFIQVTGGATVTYTPESPPPDSACIRVLNGTCVLSGVSASCIRVDSGGTAIMSGHPNAYTSVGNVSIRADGVFSMSCQAQDERANVQALYVMSGGTAVMTCDEGINAGAPYCTVLSGGSLSFNKNIVFAYSYYYGCLLRTEEGAVVQLLNDNGTPCTSPRDILIWKGINRYPKFAEYYRFNNHGLKLADNTAIHYGWNVVNVTVPAGTVGVFATGGSITATGVGPVEQILCTGTAQTRYNSPIRTVVGFSIQAVRSIAQDTTTDHYPEFRLRQNKT